MARYGYGDEYTMKSDLTYNAMPVYKLGRYSIRVDFENKTLHCSTTTQREKALESLTIYDGQINIDLSDIVSEVLDKSEPSELAAALWQDADVRERFIEAMVERYSSDSVTDADRRSVLHKIAVQTNDKAVDTLSDIMRKWEFEFCRRSYVYQEISRVNSTLQYYEVMVPTASVQNPEVPGEWIKGEPTLLQIRQDDQRVEIEPGKFVPGPVAISGQAWNEAREHWREEIMKMFPAPLAPMPLALDPLIAVSEQISRLKMTDPDDGQTKVWVGEKDLDAVLREIRRLRGIKEELNVVTMPEAEPPAPEASGDDIPF